MKALIVDLDDTLCDISHRRQYYGKDWDRYNRLLIHDPIIYHVAEFVNYLRNKGYEIIIATGRYERYRLPTESWLVSNHISYNKLWMKPNEDDKSSAIWKVNKIQNFKLSLDCDIVLVDDRMDIMSKCRKFGCITLHPDEIKELLRTNKMPDFNL